MGMHVALVDEIRDASSAFGSVGDKHRDEVAAYATMRGAEIVAAATKLGPDDCCPECKGSGAVERTRTPAVEAYHVRQNSSILAIRDGLQKLELEEIKEHYTITCAKCGGRGYLMPWQKEEETADDSASGPEGSA